MHSMFDYPAFEDHFRGDAGEIRRKLSVYLPFARRLGIDRSCPVLDVGCGRGEWLTLLKENGIPAFGFDSNADFIRSCLNDGLQVEQKELFAYLDERPEQRYGLISAFHFIEHLDVEDQVHFIRHAFERLAPGGMLLLETPNPENATVGACNFYIDPTHRRPVPPSLLEFMARDAGFPMPRIVRLNRPSLGLDLEPMPGYLPYADYYNRLRTLLLERVFQAPDYALIACKSPLPGNDVLQLIDMLIMGQGGDDGAMQEHHPALLHETQQQAGGPVSSMQAELALKDEQLARCTAVIGDLMNQLWSVEKELRSVYKTGLGKILKKYKSWKKKRKACKRRVSEAAVAGPESSGNRSDLSTGESVMKGELSASASKIYRSLIRH